MDLRRSDQIVGVVLAGGGSRRMGTDKALLPRLNGAGTWLGAAVDTLSACLAEVWIVGRNCDDLSEVRDLDLKNLRVLPDLREGVGPLAGVETALQSAGSRSVLTLPCDLPYLRSETLQGLLEAAGNGTQSAACFVQPGGRIEPAVAVYRPEALAPLRDFLDSGRRSVARFLETLEFEGVPLSASLADQFRNANTPEDLQAFRSGD